MSVHTNMRLGERTHDISYIPPSIDNNNNNNIINDDNISQYNKSTFNRSIKHKSSSLTSQQQQRMYTKYTNLKNEYTTLCKQINNMKHKVSNFEHNLNTYRNTPLSSHSKHLKSKITDKAHQPPLTYSNTIVKSTPYYTKDVLDKLARTEFYAEIGTPKEIYTTIKDKVLERSLYLYNNKHCHTCAQCLSLGASSYKCPKCHHLNVYE